MAKIRLELDSLTVESFSTAPSKDERGTVFGHLPPETYQRYCSEGLTCGESYDFCGTAATDCGTCAASDCGTCATACGTCATNCGTCDPYCCCTCSCY